MNEEGGCFLSGFGWNRDLIRVICDATAEKI